MADLAAFLAGGSLQPKKGSEDGVIGTGFGGGATTKKAKRKSSSGFSSDFDDQDLSDPGLHDVLDDDDDDYLPDDSEKKPVDLDAFMGATSGDGEDGEEDDLDEEEEGEEGDEDEDEFETEDEDGLEPGAAQAPLTMEMLIKETPSQEMLRLQREYNLELVKSKKKGLIRDYLRDMKRLHHLRAKNCYLSLKIQSKMAQAHSTVDRYVQAELTDISRRREASFLARSQAEKECAALLRAQRENRLRPNRPPKKHQQFVEVESAEGARLSEDQEGPEETCPKELDVSLKTLGRENEYQLQSLKKPQRVKPGHCKRKSKVGDVKKLKRFSFERNMFFSDTETPKPTTSMDLMNLSLNQLVKVEKGAKVSVRKKSMMRPKKDKKSVNIHLMNTAAEEKKQKKERDRSISQTISRRLSYAGLVTGRKKKKFEITKDATRFHARLTKLALDKHVTEHQIMLQNAAVDLKNLNHFKFEFADPRLTAKQVSMKMREELMKLLHHRKIPVGRKKWPLEVKGVHFPGRNPYGRVQINYSRPTGHELDTPHIAYRMSLTNIAYLNTKEKRMNEMHKRNLLDLKAQRIRLESGIQRCLNEIVSGLRICASLSGITTSEKRKAKEDTEKFIDYLLKISKSFLQDLLRKLYKAISMNEFALRRLSISEGKGEGAELHEFKDIMRGADKLKSEHRSVTRTIMEYQRYCNDLVQNVRNTDRRLRSVMLSVDTVKTDLKQMTTSVGTIIDGMHLSQRVARYRLQQEKVLNADAGIVSSPGLFNDYLKVVGETDITLHRKKELQRQLHRTQREIYKIIPVTVEQSSLFK